MHAVLFEVPRASERRATRRLEHVDCVRGAAVHHVPDHPRDERDLGRERGAGVPVDTDRVLDEVLDAHPPQLFVRQLEVRAVGRHQVELDRALGGERRHRRQGRGQLTLATPLVLPNPPGRRGGRAVTGRRCWIAGCSAGSRVALTRRKARVRVQRQAGRPAQPAPRWARVVEHTEQRAPGRALRHERPPPSERLDPLTLRRLARSQRRPARPTDLQVDEHDRHLGPELVHVGLQQRGHVDDAEGVRAEVEHLRAPARRLELALDRARDRLGQGQIEPVDHRRAEHGHAQRAGRRRRRVGARGVQPKLVRDERLLAGDVGPQPEPGPAVGNHVRELPRRLRHHSRRAQDELGGGGQHGQQRRDGERQAQQAAHDRAHAGARRRRLDTHVPMFIHAVHLILLTDLSRRRG